jgi:peptidoglycan-associated lipoprotein
MVFFDLDMSEIRNDAERVLRAKIPILQASPAVRLRLEGHADERGSTEYNLALGTRRAESVRQFLSNFGVAADRFTITSYGEERPRALGAGESAWAQNRRVEFVITAGENQINVPMTNR